MKTDSLKKGRGYQAGLRTFEAQEMRSRGSEERNSTFNFRFHCFRCVPFVCIIDYFICIVLFVALDNGVNRSGLQLAASIKH